METESGAFIDEPSEDAIFEVVGGLDSGNTFLMIESTGNGRDWYVVIRFLDSAGFEVELRDAATGEHEVYVSNDRSKIAKVVTIWIAGRLEFARQHADRLDRRPPA